MKNQDNTDGWNDGWHTQASTADSVNTLRDSILGTAKAAVKSATTRDSNHDSKTKTREDGWSGDGHATASPRESLSTLRDSSVEAAKSTAKMATTREGWWRIAKGTGKVISSSATIAIVVMHEATKSQRQRDIEAALSSMSPDHLKNGFLENNLIENDLLENNLIENESIDGERTYL